MGFDMEILFVLILGLFVPSGLEKFGWCPVVLHATERPFSRYGLRYVDRSVCTDRQGLRWPPASRKSLDLFVVVVLSRR